VNIPPVQTASPRHPIGRVELYRSGLIYKEWRWRFRAWNGNIVADSAEGYKRRIDARKMAERLFPDAEIREL
jgi:uncharacterized protein